jgi:ATP-dependent DNA helicase RecQ
LIAATGKRTIAYHGGMSQEERKTAENLISNQFPEVIVATSAFGMGMDYPHLQYVVLWQAPLSLLSLVQIIGRVGRNPNQLGQALILWDEEDFRMIEWTIQDSQKRRKEVSDLLKFLSGSDCRRNALKWHFDKVHINQPCGRCDVCEQSRHHNKNCHWPKTCYPYSY